jgi:eukaryotic-like serine/threonine-protein kinase
VTAREELPPAVTPLLQIQLQNVVAGGDVVVRDITVNAPPPPPEDLPRLVSLLRRVRADYITGMLEHSVHAAVLDLNKELRGEVIAHPAASTLERSDRTRRRLAPGESLISLFDEVGFGLLILGGAGSGKTFSLLELARDLLDRAERDLLARTDAPQAVPVYFNLSTWTERLPLLSWLAKEFGRFEVPDRQARAWLGAQRVVLLLDGLDEVRQESRAACVEAINAFKRDPGTPGVIVCSRLDEYTALRPVRLVLRGAVCLEPLSPEQVEAYVARAGPRLGALREALRSDNQLQTLASTPLMLSVMSLAYHDLPAEALRGEALDSEEERRTQLFTTYVRQMFSRAEDRPVLYPPERTLSWLTLLARGMRRHAESVFLIERLQPDWLLTPTERWTYTVASRLLCGAAVGVVLGLSLNLGLTLLAGASVASAQDWVDFFDRMRFGLLLGVVDGFMAGVVDAWRFERSLNREEVRSRRTARQVAVDVVAYVLALGLVGWLLVTSIGAFQDPVTGLTVGLLAGLLFGIVFGFHDSRRGARDDIRTIEAVRWSWTDAWLGCRRGLARGLACGGVIGIVGLLIGGPAVEKLDWLSRVIFCVVVGLITSAGGGLLGASFGGLQGSTIPVKALPNQGIALSVRNAVLSGLLVGIALGAACWIAVGARAGWHDGLIAGLVGGLFFGMLAALGGGMLDVIQHYTLRLVLAVRGYAPADYSRFLDYAVGLVLLQRAGGGYLFIHRLLLDHFADGGAAPTPPSEPIPSPSEASMPPVDGRPVPPMGATTVS